jgi:hypothetical protein
MEVGQFSLQFLVESGIAGDVTRTACTGSKFLNRLSKKTTNVSSLWSMKLPEMLCVPPVPVPNFSAYAKTNDKS